MGQFNKEMKSFLIELPPCDNLDQLQRQSYS